MIIAAPGFPTLTMGSMGPEVIDVAVILNAFRAAEG